MPDAAADRLSTALADRYSIIRELGTGGMATVYLADDVKHHRQVALKVLHPELGQALGADRFLREIEVAARLRHPHILPLYDSGSAGGLLYYVMPYAEGETLRARLQRERQLPIDDALRIAREIADALSYAHAQGVVHRDVKPENILLEAGHAVVADFGIAKALRAATDDTSLTATGTSLGTPVYMSPEQAAGDTGVDGRSDLYSLACVLYEMLAGQPPFTGPNAEALVRQHMVATPAPVTQFRPAVPGPVADALARALAKNPADRFNPVGQFATALADAPHAAHASSGPVRPPRRRFPPLLWGVAAVVLLAVAAVGVLARGGQPDESSIAVLPFRITGGDTAATALAAGIHGELVTELTQIAGLRVASRGAVLDYDGSPKSERTIAEELAVSNILTGTLQRAGDQVRLTMSLSDPARGAELWAQRYDRRLSAENIFALQAEVARAVAGTLRLRLAPADTASRPPTSNVAALELYYRAEQEWATRSGSTADSLAADHAARAVALDPEFARAWGLLTLLRSWLIRTGTESDTVPARRALDRVKQLAPGSVEARLAEGYYRYYAQADFAGALEAMEAASELSPESAELLGIRALLERRLGRLDAALSHQREAVAREPRRLMLLTQLTETLTMLRRYDEATEVIDRQQEVAPTSGFAVMQRLRVLVYGVGDSAAARKVVEDAEPLLTGRVGAEARDLVAYVTRDTAAFGDQAEGPSDGFGTNYADRGLLRALLARATGDTRTARAEADSLRRRARAEIARLSAGWDPFGGRDVAEMTLALADAIDGRAAEAVARAEAAAASLSVERDAVEGASMLYWLAQVYLLAGRRDDAVGTLHKMVVAPTEFGRGNLRLDPVWDPLRGDPEFDALAAGS